MPYSRLGGNPKFGVSASHKIDPGPRLLDSGVAFAAADRAGAVDGVAAIQGHVCGGGCLGGTAGAQERAVFPDQELVPSGHRF